MKAEQILSAKARVESGNEVRPLTISFFIWLISSIAITIATGIYLWGKDQNITCLAPNSNADLTQPPPISQWVDVSLRFR
jgi:hypothetical protein